MNQPFNTITQALDDLRQGKMVILIDDESRENEGDLIIAAEKITPEAINFMCHFGRGLVCLSLSEQDFERLAIPMMTKDNRTPHQTAFGVSFEAASGVTTGISAQDRAHSVKVAIDPKSGPDDIIIPGHMFPLRAVEGGVLKRRGHTEGSSDLSRLAGLKPAAVICEIMNDDGSMARLDDLIEFSKKHNLSLLRLKDLVEYRLQHEKLISEITESTLPIKDLGQFTIKVFFDKINQQEHLAIISKTEGPNPLVRLHSECLTGDVFGSERCDCGQQLDLALAEISKQGGVLLYLRQEGRGIGLANKIKAYALQDHGLDTVEANHKLGFEADEREYALAAEILKSLDLKTIRLLTNNPHKIDALKQHGIDVMQRVPLETEPNQSNIDYLTTKRNKLGHLLNLESIRTAAHDK